MYENHTCSCMVIIHFAPKGLRFYCPRAATRAPGSRSAAFLVKSRRVCPHWANPPSVVFVNGRRLSFLSARTGHPPPFHVPAGPRASRNCSTGGGKPPARATYLPRCGCLFSQQFLQLLLQSFGIQSGGHDFSVGSDEQRMGNGPHAIHLARYTLPALQV